MAEEDRGKVGVDRHRDGFTAEALEQVADLLRVELGRLPALLAGPCCRVDGAGGKRLRPALLLAAAACGGTPSGADHVRAAVVVELLHLATLVHDDLIEGAEVRRGVPTINAAEGPRVAVLAGDALLGAVGALASALDPRAGQLVQQALVDLCAGQALEEQLRYRLDPGAENVLAVARGKAGTLTRLACQLAATVTPSMHPQLADALADFGCELGTCLQIVDDVLDLVSSESRLGKPTGVDFPAGVITLPAVPALARDGELRALLRPNLTRWERERALVLLRRGDGIAISVMRAGQVAREARSRLADVEFLGNAVAIARLAELPDHYLDRQLTQLVDRAHRHLLPVTSAPQQGLVGATVPA